jgi:large subunit ribosomal protein L29
MKPSELRGLGDDDLARTLDETEKEIFTIRFQTATDRADTGTQIAKKKALIARIKTEQRARELKKLQGLSDDQLNQAIAAEQGKTELPGKRRAQRQLDRLLEIQAQRLAKSVKATATAVKGK